MTTIRTIDSQLMDETYVEKRSGGLVPGASDSGGLTGSTSETRGDALPTSSTKPVGQVFEENKNVIWSSLMNDEVSSVGIYGMGGVGKTTLLKHIYNQLLERPETYHHVYWVTVSQNFSINRLQNLITKCIGLDLSKEGDELCRAAKLSKELKEKQKWVLILDDLWNYFELHEVGIPVQVKGCKLILTTRSKQVCQRMDIQNKLKVMPLSEGEAWALFMEKLGHNIALSSEMEQLAKSITNECDGLPLAIITMAGAMKGVDDMHEWRLALQELKESKVRLDDMEPEVFRILRFSYMHLNDSTLQQCLLYCSMFPEDFEVERNNLIDYLIDEGVIKGLNSRESEFDKGHSMLNRLENVCLLEGHKWLDNKRYVKMHDLIRDMALQIQQENSQIMVKAGAKLREMPEEEEWTENLVRVSLMENNIEKIPSGHSPKCPNLSTLLLRSNVNLRFIANSFFKQLQSLKILDLSCTLIEKIPDSVSDLGRLGALLLVNCHKLRHLPSLKNLRALKRLDLSGTALENMPQDMVWLSNLRYLRLHGCGQKEFPTGVLPKLSRLQVFVLDDRMSNGFEQIDAPVTVKGKEVACLTKLEALECHFEHLSDFVEFLKSRHETHSLSTYKIYAGQRSEIGYERIGDPCRSKIELRTCNDAKNLSDVSFMKYATDLEIIHVWCCNSMESLLPSSWSCFAPLPLPSNRIFSCLRRFYCFGCTSMKKLFPLILLPNLVNLEEISVFSCEKMEEIIATRDEERVMGEETSSSSSHSITEFNLPKLRTLVLAGLPELKSICSAKLICKCLEVIKVLNCPQLKRMPICLPLLENGQPSPPLSLKDITIKPKEWWESVVEWEHPNAKDVLLPFVKFSQRTTCDFPRSV